MLKSGLPAVLRIFSEACLQGVCSFASTSPGARMHSFSLPFDEISRSWSSLCRRSLDDLPANTQCLVAVITKAPCVHARDLLAQVTISFVGVMRLQRHGPDGRKECT